MSSLNDHITIIWEVLYWFGADFHQPPLEPKAPETNLQKKIYILTKKRCDVGLPVSPTSH